MGLMPPWSFDPDRRAAVPVVLLVVAALAGACAGSAAPTSSPTASGPAPTASGPAPTAPTGPTAVPVPTGSLAPEGWTVIELDHAARAPATVTSVQATRDDFVAIGGRQCIFPAADEIDPEDCYGLMWTSADGLTWDWREPVDAIRVGINFPTSGPGPGFDAAAAGPAGVLVVGNAWEAAGALGPATWLLDGSGFERVPADAFGSVEWDAVTASPDRYVVLGTIPGGPEPRMAAWTSADGRSWTRAPDAAAFAVGGWIDTTEHPAHPGADDLTWDGSRFLATGSTCNEMGLECHVAAWTSPDGVAWARVELPDIAGRLEHVTRGPGGYAAVGLDCGRTSCSGLALASDDGETWTASGTPLPMMHGVAATPTGFVAVGSDETMALRVLGSPDGLAWEEIDVPAIPAGARLRDVSVTGGPSMTVIAVSTEGDGDMPGYVFASATAP